MESNKTTLLTQNKNTVAKAGYRAAALVAFICVCGVSILRLIVYALINAGVSYDVAVTIFDVCGQIGVNLILVFVIFKTMLNMSTKQTLKFSFVRKTRWFNYCFAILLGIVVFVATIGVATFWNVFIKLLGYNTGSSSTTTVEAFSVGYFILQIVLCAVLPAICEEFAVRGGLSAVMQNSFSLKKYLFFMAIAFGLFHQSITQFFYTAAFGILFAYLVYVTRSIWPGVIVHFLNNFLGTYIDFAGDYNWFLGDFYTMLNSIIVSNYLGFILLIAGLIVTIIIVTKIVAKLNKYHDEKDALQAKTEAASQQAEQSQFSDAKIEKEYRSYKLVDELYKPTLSDNILFIGAIVISASYTVFTLLYGFVV